MPRGVPTPLAPLLLARCRERGHAHGGPWTTAGAVTSLRYAIAIVVVLAVVGIRPEVEWARSPSAAVVVMAGPR